MTVYSQTVKSINEDMILLEVRFSNNLNNNKKYYYTNVPNLRRRCVKFKWTQLKLFVNNEIKSG